MIPPLLTYLNAFPPALCRIVARTNRGMRLLTRREISLRSGLSLRQVDTMSFRGSWRGFGIESICAFAYGCDVDMRQLRRHKDWLKRRQKRAWKGNEKLVRKCQLCILEERRVSNGKP